MIKKVAGWTAAYLAVAAIMVGYMIATGLFAGRSTGLDPETVARGATLYAEHCARCHGVNLEGQPGWQTRRADGTIPAPPQNATGHTSEHPDRFIFDITKLGGGLFCRADERSEMPAFGSVLKDSDIWAVIAFIKSTWPEDVRARQFRANMLGSFQHH